MLEPCAIRNMSVNWLVCIVTCGFFLYSKQVTGTPVGLNRRARYVEVDKTEFDCTGKGSGYFVHPTSCSEFYACQNGKAYKSECIPGLLYHQITTYCENPSIVDCSRSTMATGTMTQTTTIGQSTSAMMQSTMTSMSPITQQSTTMMPTTQSVPMTTTVAITTKPTTMMMSTTQMMTTSTMSTMMSTMTITPAPPTSTVMTTTPPTTTTPTTTVVTTTPPMTTMKTTTTQAPATTARSKKVSCRHKPVGTLLRNPDTCNSYYECLPGGPLLLHCGPATVFNQKAGVCDYRYHVPECH